MYSNTEKKEERRIVNKKDSSHLFAIFFSLKTFDGFSFSLFPTYVNKIVPLTKENSRKKKKTESISFNYHFFLFKPKKI